MCSECGSLKSFRVLIEYLSLGSMAKVLEGLLINYLGQACPIMILHVRL